MAAKILIIDDEPLIVDMYDRLFKHAGFDVLIAKDPRSGLEKAKQEKPTIILLDIMMPEMNAIDVLKALKKDEATKSIPVLVLTNLSDDKIRDLALAHGAAKYLIKSELTPNQVIEAVKQYLISRKD